MKKLFYLLIGILLLIPAITKADMASPLVISYKATVNNPNGIDDYEEKTVNNESQWVKTGKKIPYGTIFEIDEEDREYMCNENYCAKYSDLVAIEKNYKLKQEEIGEEITFKTLKETNIKSGPAQAYETIGKIKANETVKGKNVIALNEAEEGDTPWYYVEYNGIKGYVSELDDTMAGKFYNSTIMAIEDIDLFDLNKNKVKTLKAFETLDVKFCFLSGWSRYIYIETNDFKGYVDQWYVAFKGANINDIKYEENEKFLDTPIEYTTTDEIKVYEKANKFDSKVITTIPKGTTFASEYYLSDYEDIFVYYEKDDIKGFAQTNNYECSDDGYSCKLNKETNNNISEEPKKDEPKKEETNEEPKKEVKKAKSNNNTTLFICIGAGIILSITAIITIILINKKRKQKEL